VKNEKPHHLTLKVEGYAVENDIGKWKKLAGGESGKVIFVVRSFLLEG